MTPDIPPEIDPAFLEIAGELSIARPVLCDVGSRDARESIFLFHHLRGRRLHIFEPNPAAAEICRKNIRELAGPAGDERIIFNQAAVTDAVGTASFYVVNREQSENKDIGFSSLYKINPRYTRRHARIVQDEITVNTTTLDSYFAGLEYPDILWIDVEGAEMKVLEGACAVLGHVRLVHLEVAFRAMHVGRPLFWDVDAHLKRFGLDLAGFLGISSFKGFLYRRRLLPNPPWHINVVYRRPHGA